MEKSITFGELAMEKSITFGELAMEKSITFEDDAFGVAIKPAAEEKHHHMVLLGRGISRVLKSTGTDWNLFKLHRLNYLSITQTNLPGLSIDIGLLTKLMTLIVHSNKIRDLPSTISNLVELEVLDCSRNLLMLCPEELGVLPKLKVLNLASNRLLAVPSMRKNIALTVLNLGSNKLDSFPDVCYKELVCLSELYVNDNKIQDIPSTISNLSALKVLDLKYNLLKDLPNELANCEKLEKLNVEWNKMDDDNLNNLCSSVTNTKKIIEYLKAHPIREKKLAVPNIYKKRNINLFVSRTNPLYILKHILEIKGVTDGAAVVKVKTEHAKNVRPFIAACIIKDIKFTEENFKKFIQLQTKTFYEEGEIRRNKNMTSLVTHDMEFITPGDLIYTAKQPKELNIKPFPRNRVYTGEVLYKELQLEAENVRKITEKKEYPERYECLKYLRDKTLFPCLLDNSQLAISFPPIINSNTTKVSPFTQTMFVEVTSTVGQGACKIGLDQFLSTLLISGITNPTLDAQGRHHMIVEQVKVEDDHGNPILIYPSKEDFSLVKIDENIRMEIKRQDGIP